MSRSRIPSTLTPLLENWRRRVRGNERRFLVPFSYVLSEAAPVDEVDDVPVDEVDEAGVELQPVHRAERTGELERRDGVGPTERRDAPRPSGSYDWAGPGERQGEDDPTVLRFPGESRVARLPEPSPPARPSGPLSWAYWAARHQ
ncbi:MAG: hypothetical protein O7E50_04995 [Gemmatimonadetes bacterium]|nr:hypothetical protein [Gemmatimonadota bacterium]